MRYKKDNYNEYEINEYGIEWCEGDFRSGGNFSIEFLNLTKNFNAMSSLGKRFISVFGLEQFNECWDYIETVLSQETLKSNPPTGLEGFSNELLIEEISRRCRKE